ncbi:MAG: hypothetical protein H7Z16_14880 [Pyrinomonadaceae bacterium]|nr:hypothetical protein [Pyrinomonadaceae bacterium]
MGAKEILSYVGGIVTFVLVGLALRRRVPEELALGIGWLAAFLIGFPFTRSLSAKAGKRLMFGEWAVFSTLGALAGIAVVFLMKRFGL